jgi:hypothetical protein
VVKINREVTVFAITIMKSRKTVILSGTKKEADISNSPFLTILVILVFYHFYF